MDFEFQHYSNHFSTHISYTKKANNYFNEFSQNYFTSAGTLKVGDELRLQIDETRRVAVMQNHTGTHVLNYALRKVLSADADQRGSLVAPERMRFDFASNKPMSAAEVRKAEEAANELVLRNADVYAKDSSLAQAKAVKGLRAVFNETYPDPVRVVSIGVPVDDLLSNPDRGDALNTSVEFCGGTHLKNAGHIGDFVISQEEAIAKGIRRVVALTGLEAAKANKRAEHFETEVKFLCENVTKDKVSFGQFLHYEKLFLGSRNKLSIRGMTYCGQAIISLLAFSFSGIINKQSLVKRLTELSEEISQSTISYWRKDDLRNELKKAKKILDEHDKLDKAASLALAVEEIKRSFSDGKFVIFTPSLEIYQSKNIIIYVFFFDRNLISIKLLLHAGDAPSFLVKELQVGGNNKALDAALKQVRLMSPSVAAMFFSVDKEKGRLICLSAVPKQVVADKGLSAVEWVRHVADVIGGKGGGKDESAQASGTNPQALNKAIDMAEEFARLKLV